MTFFSVRRFIALIAPVALIALGVAQPAQATPFVTGPVTVTEHEPPFSDLVNNLATVVAFGTAEIAQGDGTDLGGFLLDGEFIDIDSSFGHNTILFSVRGNGTSNTGHPAGFFDAGYSSTAQYLFSGFSFSSPGHIIGVSASSPGSGVSDLGTLNLGFTNDSITLDFGGLGVLGSNTNLGSLLLTIQVQDDGTQPPPPAVPEPASLTLLGSGLAAAYWRRRRNAR
jgi:hypothetical protein